VSTQGPGDGRAVRREGDVAGLGGARRLLVWIGGVGSGSERGFGWSLCGEGRGEQQGTTGGEELQVGVAEGEDHVRQRITGRAIAGRGIRQGIGE
jgi:hypothetical protein